MTERAPWDDLRLRVADQRKLAAAGVDLTDEKVALYVKNRNDYGEPNYNTGRDAVDKALNAQAEALYRDSESVAEAIRRAAWQAEKASQVYGREVSHAEGVEALVALSDALGALQKRVETLAAALGVRADDDDADAALGRFSDALMGRTTPTEG